MVGLVAASVALSDPLNLLAGVHYRDSRAEGGCTGGSVQEFASGKSLTKTFSQRLLREAREGAICARFYVRLFPLRSQS